VNCGSLGNITHVATHPVTRAGAALSRHFHPVRPELSLVSFLADYMLTFHERCYPLISETRLSGVASLIGLRKSPGEERHERSLSDIR
jgi:hypothetical protein